ncbi:MAG: FadR family transcriptional regulator [Firmicutes bacterium]|nr:FadR family transcriptional regulator [Bacillota bacterium]
MEPLQADKLSVRVCERLEAYIKENELMPGDRLPTQKKLARLLGISMSSLREGLQYAEALGLVRTKQGSGTFVQEPSVDSLFLSQQATTLTKVMLLNDKEWSDLLQMRGILETAAAALAAERVGAEDLRLLHRQIDLMKKHKDNKEAFAEADIVYHEILVRVVGNSILEQVFTNMRDLIRRHQLMILDLPGEGDKSIVDHREIYQRLLERDGPGAQKAMEKHLRHTTRLAKEILGEEVET